MDSEEDISWIARITRRLWPLCGAGLAASLTLWTTGYWSHTTHLNVQIGFMVLTFIIMGLEMARVLYSGYLQHHQIGPTTCACFAVAILCGGICWLVWIMPSIGTNDVNFVINLIVGVLVGGYALAYGAIMWDRRALRVIDGDATYGGSWLFGQKVGPYRLWSRSSALVWFVILAVVVVMVQFNFAPFEAGAFYETAKIIGIGLFLLIVASELPGKYRLHSHYGPIVIFVLGHTAIAAVLTMILAPEPISHLLAPSPALSTIGFVFIAAYAAILLGQTWEKRLAAAREVTTVKPLPADAP